MNCSSDLVVALIVVLTILALQAYDIIPLRKNIRRCVVNIHGGIPGQLTGSEYEMNEYF